MSARVLETKPLLVVFPLGILGNMYLMNQVNSQYIIRKEVELGLNEKRESSIW